MPRAIARSFEDMMPCVEEEADEEDMAEEGSPMMLGRLAKMSATRL